MINNNNNKTKLYYANVVWVWFHSTLLQDFINDKLNWQKLTLRVIIKNNSAIITKSITVVNYNCTNNNCQLTLHIAISSTETLTVKTILKNIHLHICSWIIVLITTICYNYNNQE